MPTPTKAELIQALQMCNDIMDDAGIEPGDFVQRADALARRCAMPDLDCNQVLQADIEVAMVLAPIEAEYAARNGHA